MSEASKYNFSKAEKVQIFEQVDTYIENNYTFPDPQTTEATRAVADLLQNIRKQCPQATDAEILEIIEKGFTTLHQTNPQKWRGWVDLFSIVFAGGVEAIKLVAPPWGFRLKWANSYMRFTIVIVNNFLIIKGVTPPCKLRSTFPTTYPLPKPISGKS